MEGSKVLAVVDIVPWRLTIARLSRKMTTDL